MQHAPGLALSVFLSMAACSAPAQIRDLRRAEAHERAGEHEEALRAYRSAQTSCSKVDGRRRRRESCAAAHLQYAELLVTMNREREAIAAYGEAERRLGDNRAAAARASYNAGLLHLQLGELESAYQALWRTVTHYPDQGFAADALKQLLRDGRQRSPELLRTELRILSEELANTQIADNLLSACAELEEEELDSPEKALRYHDLLIARYPDSGFFDDALWHGARLSRRLGDPEGAVRRLRKLLATREVAFGAGSYFSVWLDNAQLELGIILRDELGDLGAAARSFTRLPRDYPDSVLKDDALYQRALTRKRAGLNEQACKDLRALNKKYPDSKYELEKAPKLRSELGCPL